MAISDIFSSTFLVTLAITLCIASMLYIYISNKFAEQNHKINSMFSLISTMAEEQQYFRVKLLGKNSQLHNLDNVHFATQLLNTNNMSNDLISVSDNQEQESGSDNDSDNDSDNGSENDSDNESEYNDDEYDIEEHQKTNNIDILNLSLINHNILGSNKNDDSNNDQELVDIDSENTSITTINLNNIKTIHLEEPIIQINNNNDLDLSSEININDDNTNENIHFELMNDNDNDNDNDTINTIDNYSKQEYKKMSLDKLRKVVVEKGFIQDASKLKKNEIIKMLDEE